MPLRRSSPLLFAAALGCSAGGGGSGLGSEEVCEPLTLEEGEIRVKRIACSDEVPYTGEGRVGDYLLQNARASAIIRTPYEALTLLDMPGGTLVDFITLDAYDAVFEAAPLVEGGWLEPESLEIDSDGESAWVRVSGRTLPIPFLGGSEGAPAEITWRLDADSDVLEIEGSESLYLHARAGAELVDEHLARYDVRLQPLGELSEDLGGALIYEGVSGILSARADSVYAQLWPEGERVSGACAEGERVEILRGGEVVGWLEPEFDSRVPADALLRCVRAGYSGGVEVPPGSELALEPGVESYLWLKIADSEGEEIPAVVEWSGGPTPLPPGGGPLLTGPGTFSLRVSHGPRVDAWEGVVEVPDGGAHQDVMLPRRIHSDGFVMADVFREAWPSRYSRRSPPEDLALAAGEGVTYVVESPIDEVGQPYTDEPDGRWVEGLIRYEVGSMADIGAGRIWSWSWNSTAKDSGHGAMKWAGLSPEDALALASDGYEPYRYTVVDAGWLAGASPPYMWDPAPMAVRIDDLSELPAYLEVLAAGVYPGVMGPVTWIPAETSSVPSKSACERAIVTRQSVASTGPLLSLAAGIPVYLEGRWVHPLTLQLQSNAEAALTRLDLYVDGEVVQTWELPGRGGLLVDEIVDWPGDRWAIAVASGEGWAVSAPALLAQSGIVPQ